jgi:DNA-binding transcriptional LysR family regulator
MDAADLRMFEAVARLGGMGRAAAELNTVQSNVTARIREMEARLGVPLFVRHARGVDLAPAGHRLLPYARRVLRLLEEAHRVAQDDGTPAGPLVIGSLETTTALHLAPALARFTAAHPAVNLTLRTGTTCELLEQVLEGALEGAFVCGPVAHPDLEAEPGFREELVLLSTPGTRSPLQPPGPGPELRIIVLRAGCSYRQRLEELLARRGMPSPRLLEFGTLEAILACVSAGLGMTLLPRALIGTVTRPGQVAAHALPAAEGLVETVFVRRRDARRSSALGAFLDALPQQAPKLLRRVL